MKIRVGFVSNSSSCSFSVSKDSLTDNQIEMIKNHIEHARDINWDNDGYPEFSDDDRWQITEGPKEIICETFMDNFDLELFIKEVVLKIKDPIKNRWHS